VSVVVIDTNVFVAALRSGGGPSREVIRRSLNGQYQPIFWWVKIFYGWRPNLRDEGDNHLVELAIAGGAEAIVTYNIRDFNLGELRWPGLAILTPPECLETLTWRH
jgi:predicted nucleic acid-binding protein